MHNLAELLMARGHGVVVTTHGMRAVPFHYRPRAVPPTLRIHVPGQTDPNPTITLASDVALPSSTTITSKRSRRKRLVARQHLGGRSEGHLPALVQPQGAVAEVAHELEVVGRHQQRAR